MINAKNYKQPISDQDNGWGIPRLILIMIIMQSIGIRVFQFQGVVIGLVILVLLIPYTKIRRIELFLIIIITSVLVLLASRGLSNYTSLFYFSLILLIAFFYNKFLVRFQNNFEFDLLAITWLLSFHGLVSFIVYYFLPSFFLATSINGYPYLVSSIFVVATDNSDSIRATGLCWEPGLLQFVANISLFLGIKNSWPRWKLLVSTFSVIATYSTTGIFCLFLILLYFLFTRRRNLIQLISMLTVFLIFFVLFESFFYSNIEHKFGGESTSGLIRLRDMQIGWELIKHNPVFGHGLFDEQYLLSIPQILAVATNNFSNQFLSLSGNLGGGYTNGFLSIFASYGLLLGTFLYWCFFKNQLIQGDFKTRIFLFSICAVTFFSEPITNTSFFYIFVISGFFTTKLSKIHI